MSSATPSSVAAAWPYRGSSAGADEPEVLVPMTEVDLLPSWYPSMVRRRKWLLCQLWLTGGLVVVLATVLVLRRHNVAATQGTLAALENQRRETERSLAELTNEQGRLSELTLRAGLMAQAGLPMEVSRVLAELATAAPPQVALTEIDADTDEITPKPAKPGSAGPLRTMKFTLRGIAEDARQAASFEAELAKNPLFRNVKLVQARPGTIYDTRTVWAFEITFTIDLSNADDAFADLAGGPK